MSAKYKILNKLDVRFDRYYDKWIAAKSVRSIQLWDSRFSACGTLRQLCSELLDDNYSVRRCERILRSLVDAFALSDTDKAIAMLYILDDIL